MEPALPFLHLEPLPIVTVKRVDFAEGFHREIEDQFEMRDTAGEGPSFQGGDETLTGSRRIHPCLDAFCAYPLL
jgi:hypothetical protein